MTPRRTQRRAFLRTLKETLPEALALRVVEPPRKAPCVWPPMGSAVGPPVMARIFMGVAAPSSRRSARPGEVIAARSSPPRCFAAWDVATAFALWLSPSAWPGMGMCC